MAPWTPSVTQITVPGIVMVVCLTNMYKNCSLKIRKSPNQLGRYLLLAGKNKLLTILTRQCFRKWSYLFLSTVWISYPRVQTRLPEYRIVLSTAWHLSFTRLQSSRASSALSRGMPIWKTAKANLGHWPLKELYFELCGKCTASSDNW